MDMDDFDLPSAPGTRPSIEILEKDMHSIASTGPQLTPDCRNRFPTASGRCSTVSKNYSDHNHHLGSSDSIPLERPEPSYCHTHDQPLNPNPEDTISATSFGDNGAFNASLLGNFAVRNQHQFQNISSG